MIDMQDSAGSVLLPYCIARASLGASMQIYPRLLGVHSAPREAHIALALVCMSTGISVHGTTNFGLFLYQILARAGASIFVHLAGT
jgi:hypothetical protein